MARSAHGKGLSPLMSSLLGFGPDEDEETVLAEWQRRTSRVCKPCWELKYCPYGPLVEGYPLLGPTRKEAIEHNEFLKKQLADGAYDEGRTQVFEDRVKNFDSKEYPLAHHPEVVEKQCLVFGHICPVFFVHEDATETSEPRPSGRYIPRHVILRVVRRDNNQCQVCSKVLRDDEIEFDHTIPVSKGGSSSEENLRVTCLACNRSKGARFDPTSL